MEGDHGCSGPAVRRPQRIPAMGGGLRRPRRLVAPTYRQCRSRFVSLPPDPVASCVSPAKPSVNPSQPRGHRDKTRAEPTQPDRDGYTGAGGTLRLNTKSPGPGTVQSPRGANSGPTTRAGRAAARGAGVQHARSLRTLATARSERTASPTTAAVNTNTHDRTLTKSSTLIYVFIHGH